MSSPPDHPADLRQRLDGLMLRDGSRLRRRWEGTRKIRDVARRKKTQQDLLRQVEQAELRVASRAASVPKIAYPEQLPVSQKKDEILEAIRDHQVVIVAGETGSGKTTQLPKICLELGRGVRGLIGHTQPRRLAARTVAERIAEELETPFGRTVGYKVRFTDHTGDDTLVRLMTDGILLAELQHDRLLEAYDTLIIDEAHERSLNIDFLLGYLRQILPRRPDLKVIITSATIDPERFSRHFGDAPIVEVSGRTYPVEVRYRPVEDADDDQSDLYGAICDAVDELRLEPPGDILVFLSGEREIRDAADALTKKQYRDTEILPLYARLSTAEQHKVFQAHRGRRIVLATNVAETSLTVPGIKYVIDPGTARVSRYSSRLKVQRLPIEPVSQASANQRKGRCGRTSDGVCIRLYSEEDFVSRPEFTDPEILRTNLASVILQMTSLGLGDVAKFPFIDPPDRRNIKDGVDLLHELHALDAERGLTEIGRKLARLPVDPRMGRMILEADRNGCVNEVMVIAAALSIQDPRERPSDKQQASDEKHARFKDPASDFLAFLNLWNHVREAQRELSGSQFRRTMKNEFLHYLRIREWQDLVGQLKQICRDLGITVNTTPGDPYKIHVSLLSGLLSHIGLFDSEKREYVGARNAKFAIFPGSGLFKKNPRWVMSAELVETSRLWARVNAKIEPDWVEPLAQHLVKRNYSEPHWEKDQAAVMALERVTLYGVPIVTNRKVNYGRIDPELCRDLFIRHALVEGDWQTHHKFFHANRRLLAEVGELEERARRRDIVVDDETLVDFYDRRLPADVVSGAHFDTWWKKAQHTEPDLLNFEKSMLVHETAQEVTEQDYPDVWRQGDLVFDLTYQFEPGADADGVTVHIPLHVLNQVEEDGFDWMVPGLRHELVTALIRSLPKQLRVNFVPAPDFARRVLALVHPGEGALLDRLEAELRTLTGVTVPREAWQPAQIPDHLRMSFRIVQGGDPQAPGDRPGRSPHGSRRSGRGDKRRKRVAEGKDLAELKRRLAPRQRETLAKSTGIEREGLTDWDFDGLPRLHEQGRLKAYPALVDQGGSVAIRTFGTEEEQRRAMWLGVRRMILLNAPSPAKQLQNGLGNQAKLALAAGPHGSIQKLFTDVIEAAADKLMADHGGPSWDRESYGRLYDAVRADLADTAAQILGWTERILAAYQGIQRKLKSTGSLVLVPSLTDVRGQLDELVHPGFVTETGFARLPDVLRYLRAVDHRLDRLPDNPNRDRQLMAQVAGVRQEWERAGRPPEVRWMIEEYRVSLFAQSVGTRYPVSDKRIRKAITEGRPRI
ncbi:ATP-dependent RNA helicase HrpA [Actinocorallia populi]|uniref:ATP-dependent RNA helicase HrpA n=1 Tax=Actinocorallia populi TaxID=2079200 RepID=UPI001E607763|nr:ATP-dependent RNA helicase HrpA [Actinocorallia populi]